MKAKDAALKVMVVVALLLVALLVFWRNSRKVYTVTTARAQYNDATPTGGKGLRLLLANLGYTVKRTTEPLQTMPADARVWFLLDPYTSFSEGEATRLLQWVRNGGTLIWAVSGLTYDGQIDLPSASRAKLMKSLKISHFFHHPQPPGNDGLPGFVPIIWDAACVYRSGVGAAFDSGDIITVDRPHLAIAGSPFGTDLARIELGRGRVIAVPDALLFSNCGLVNGNNSVLITNLVRVHLEAGRGAIYFDERQGGDGAGKITPNLLYYLWRPPLRWAMLQLLFAGLLVWLVYGYRLGAPVPLPQGDPVTRASQFAIAMGSLFRKANRPRAAAAIIGEEFRRALVRRLGMSTTDSDRAIAARAAEMTGLPAAMIDRLLLKGANPADDESSALDDAQEMEIVMRRLSL